jgi:uncharacterized HAD superfamily protein
MKTNKIKVGIDFDGVIAYNPFRIIRAPIVYIKHNLLGVKNTRFYIPQTNFQKLIWKLMHESSFFPAKGVDLLKSLTADNVIEAHLITARYSFLQKSLYRWLDRNNLRKVFTSITLNAKDEQPHVYKERTVRNLGLDYFIEDNWDVVDYISQKKHTRVFWIYNIFDREIEYPDKYPYLEKALGEIQRHRK